MDRALDEIVAERYKGNRFQGRRSDHRPERKFYPRDGIRKSTRNDIRNIDSEWVHDKFDKLDKFDDNIGRRSIRINRRYSPSPERDPPSAKLRVENLHYDLTEDDLDDLFNRIGPVKELSLIYDRAGRSEGIAYVTYEQPHYARRAIQEYDGANAKGQPIRLISIPLNPPARRRNPPPPRPRSIFDRVTIPARKSRSFSSFSRNEINNHSQSNVDRYVPGRQTRSRSPQRFRREGWRFSDKNVSGRGAERLARDGRPKKTQEELDAEMDDYWNSKDSSNSLTVNPTQNEAMDEEMIE